MSRELEALEKLTLCCEDCSKDCSKCMREYMLNKETVKSAIERKEKLEKSWALINTNHITYEHKEIIKKANNYNEYVDLYRFSFRITDLHEYLVEEEEFNLLKEMLK